jgi:hypothetical protein
MSCGSQPSKDKVDINDYRWMLGTWLAHGLEFYEKWEVQDDSTFVGIAFNDNEGDTVVTERILFQKRGGELQYVPTVYNQNSGRAIVFKAVNAEANLIQFENMEHDFPNRIVYFNTSEQQMDVKLEGIRNGEVFQSYDILMSKME